MSGSPTDEQIVDALRTVMDPEIQKDLVSLDMVRDVAIADGTVRVTIELTTPACPLKAQIGGDVEAAIRRLDGVKQVKVDFTAQVSESAKSKTSLPGVKNVIAIGAGKGGVGKSTLSVLTAVGLSRAGASVGLLDADVYGPSIPKMLGVEGVQPTFGDPEAKRIMPVMAYDIRVMSIGFMLEPGQAVIWRGPMIHGTIQQFLEQVDWGELDYLLVDLPPGTGDVPLTLSQLIPMTGAVVVCTPQEVALADAVRAARMYQQLEVDVLGIVENMSYFIAPDTGKEYDLFGKGGAERAAAELDVPFLGSIPISIRLCASGDKGTPHAIFDEDPQGAGAAVQQVVENIAGRISVRNARKADPVQLSAQR